MEQSIEGGRAWGKSLGVSVLTSQTCSFYAGVNAAGGMCPERAIGLSDGAGVDVRLGLKDG